MSVGSVGSRFRSRRPTLAPLPPCSHAHVAFGDNDTLVIEALPVGEVKPGDKVELEMTNKDYLRLSFLITLYRLGLLGGLARMALGQSSGKGLFGARCLVGSAILLMANNYDKAATNRKISSYARPYSTSFDRLLRIEQP